MYEWILLVVVLILIVYFWRRSREGFEPTELGLELPSKRLSQAQKEQLFQAAFIIAWPKKENLSPEESHKLDIILRDAYRLLKKIALGDIAFIRAEIKRLSALPSPAAARAQSTAAAAITAEMRASDAAELAKRNADIAKYQTAIAEGNKFLDKAQKEINTLNTRIKAYKTAHRDNSPDTDD